MEPKIKREKQQRRYKRVRAKIFGTAVRPRLSVFRSAKHIYAQLIVDEGVDEKVKTIIAVDDRKIKGKKSKIDKALEVGKLIAKEAISKKIEKVVFDRGGYKYHGRVKAVADGAREGGLQF